ncbi:hypothetical protein GW17_00041150 [Ensete ventricosum]|nr:hypothetical protein GW17_00041150 [Ensete ventricosum]RZR90661.1 hypothetical protein BHM03_00018593 [Ensete ventricosum]
MEKPSLDSPLIPGHTEVLVSGADGLNEVGLKSGGEFFAEIKRQLFLAGPLIASSLLQNLLQVISVMFVGHLGELALSGASMATSFAGVTGFSFLVYICVSACPSLTALDTMCGQAFGAKQYRMLGMHMQRAMLALTLVSLPLAVIWSYTGSILKLCGQDPEIAAEAGVYARWMIPTIFAYGLLQCHVRFLQTQNIVFPMMLSTGVTALLHVLVCWLLVYKSGLGSKGAAVAISISYWTNVLLLALYIRLSPACKETWTGFSREALHDMSSFIKLAVPSATMELDMPLQNSLPWSSLEHVGVARGCGWQKIGALVNLGAYYIVGIPSAVLLAFVLHVGGKVREKDSSSRYLSLTV